MLTTQVCIEGGTCTDGFETLPYYRMAGMMMLSLLNIVLIIYSMSHSVTGTMSVIAQFHGSLPLRSFIAALLQLRSFIAAIIQLIAESDFTQSRVV